MGNVVQWKIVAKLSSVALQSNYGRLCGFTEESSEAKIVSVTGGWARAHSKVRGGVGVAYPTAPTPRKINESYSEEISH